eukprot:PhM_4_TR17383/c1_g4_i5/m.32940
MFVSNTTNTNTASNNNNNNNNKTNSAGLEGTLPPPLPMLYVVAHPQPHHPYPPFPNAYPYAFQQHHQPQLPYPIMGTAMAPMHHQQQQQQQQPMVMMLGPGGGQYYRADHSGANVSRDHLMPRSEKAKLVCRHWLVGRCCRPYCHFKHVIEEGDALPENFKVAMNMVLANNKSHQQQQKQPNPATDGLLMDVMSLSRGNSVTVESSARSSPSSETSLPPQPPVPLAARDGADDDVDADELNLSAALRDVLRECCAGGNNE